MATLAAANSASAASSLPCSLHFYVVKGKQPPLISTKQLEDSVESTGMNFVFTQNSRLDAAEIFVTMPDGGVVYCLGRRFNNFIVLRGTWFGSGINRAFSTERPRRRRVPHP